MIIAENRDLGYSSQDSDHTVSDAECEYDPDLVKSDEDHAVEELTDAIKDVYVERSPMRSSGFTVGKSRNCNVPINRPQTNNFHSGGGIINTSNVFNNIAVPINRVTQQNNVGKHLNIVAEPQDVAVHNIFSPDETLQDNLSSNLFYTQTINELRIQPLRELNGDVFSGVLEDLDVVHVHDELETLNNNQSLVEGKEICAFSNIPLSNSDWSSHRNHTHSFSTTSTVSSVSSPAEYSPLSSSSEQPQSDDQLSRQSTPDLANYFTPTLNEYKGEVDPLIPKTVNEEQERCSAKELVQKLIKQYPKERKRALWVAASRKTPAELMIDIRELVESNLVDELAMRLYASVEVFLKNATKTQCWEVFGSEPTVWNLLGRKEQRLLQRYVDEVVQERCPTD